MTRRVPNWVTAYPETTIPAAYRDTTAIEQSSTKIISAYHPLYVDGLAQTPAYAASVLSRGWLDPGVAAERLEYRMRRGKILEVRVPPRLSMVIGSTALSRAEQIDPHQVPQLIRLDKRENVDVRVLDLDVPAEELSWDALGGGFRIMEGPDQTIVVAESVLDTTYTAAPSVVDRQQEIFGDLQRLARPLSDVYPQAYA